MRAIDFRGFRFGNTHTSDLNLEVVSTSNRYEARVLPAPSDYVNDVPGGDGQYYYGSTYKNREIICNVAFDSVSEQIYRKIRQLFATDKLLDLVFDEEPYKTWKAKLKSKPEFKSICFTDKESGERVYKGEGKLTFICYYPYAFGFDKYVVRAADYYMLNPPECIINEAESDDTFVKSSKERNMGRMLPEDIKYHYNLNPSDYIGGTNATNISTENYRDKSHQNREDRTWDPNGDKPWKTGFPTPEQVRAGELFFDTDQGERSIVDVRGYWDNIPEWQGTANLLTTPTLDFEQELMYLPQYSKVNYINMETGFDSNIPMVGSRLLVYNPGDLPVDWEIRFDENKRSFWSTRGGTKFRVRRFNVQRLPIECAVDWCGLTTYDLADNEKFKYGTKYFKRRALNISNLIERLRRLQESTNDEVQTLKNINLYIRKPVEVSGDYYSIEEIINNLKNGIAVADKKNMQDDSDENEVPYSNTRTWKEIYESGQAKNLFDPYNTTHNSTPAYSTAFNLRISETGWGALFNTNFNVLPLGKSHPHHCYYVEPIPKERLDHFIKLFFWQTIQWRGDVTLNKDLTSLDRWKTMLSKELFNQEKLEDGEYYIADQDNPLIPFLSNFIDFSNDGKMTVKNTSYAMDLRKAYLELNYEEGIAFANRYREMYDSCIDDMERYELYWDTLKKLLKMFTPMFNFIIKNMTGKVTNFEGKLVNLNSIDGMTLDQMVDNFIDSYINRPLEYIGEDMRDLNYGEFTFNGFKFPSWITEDYIEIDQSELSNVVILKQYLAAIEEDEDAIFNGRIMYYTPEDRQKLIDNGNYSNLIKKLDTALGTGGCLNDLLDDYYYLNSDTRMLYTTANPYGMEFVYKPNKVVMNEAISRGKWFKIPPGWSLIAIEPVVNETEWGGKRWEDGRPYDWGYGGDVNRNKREAQQLFDFVYDRARLEFLKEYPIEKIKDVAVLPEYVESESDIFAMDIHGEPTPDRIYGTEDPYDELFKFKIWYEKFLEEFPEKDNYFAYGYYRKLRSDAEYHLLKIINDYWGMIAPYFAWTSQKGVYIEPSKENWNGSEYTPDAWPTSDDYDVTGKPLRNINGDISDWWWYACNYFWANFPPLYWAMADMLNKIQIKYTPLFY